MPELAEVAWFCQQWNVGLGQRIEAVLIHDKKRIFRGVDLGGLVQTLTGAKLEKSETRGKQMLFVIKPRLGRDRGWLGLHLGMTGKLRAESADFKPEKHDHLVLRQMKQALVFTDARLFGRIHFSLDPHPPNWWTKIAPDLLSPLFTVQVLSDFLRRRPKSPLKAVLLMQERFPGIGNWMADEILWRAALHPKQPAGDLDPAQTRSLHREILWVCREALRIIGREWGDPPDSWLFNHRWKKGGTDPRTGTGLLHATIGGRTTCWSPARQKLLS